MKAFTRLFWPAAAPAVRCWCIALATACLPARPWANYQHQCYAVQRVQDGELLLMDAGCELHGYCSDVTRTWPVNGTFDKYQRAIYEVVLDAHRY